MRDLSKACWILPALALAACGGRDAAPAGNTAKTTAAATSAPVQTSAPTATATATAAPTATATAAPSGATSIFEGEPDPSVKLAATHEKFGGLGVMIRKPIGWTLVTDPTLGYMLATSDGSAKLFVGDTKPGSAMTAPPADLLALSAAKDVKAGAVQKGTVGKFALAAQIGEATAKIAEQKDTGKLYFFQMAIGGPHDVTGLVILRAGVKPENEKAMIAAIKTLKRPSDK